MVSSWEDNIVIGEMIERVLKEEKSMSFEKMMSKMQT